MTTRAERIKRRKHLEKICRGEHPCWKESAIVGWIKQQEGDDKNNAGGSIRTIMRDLRGN